MRYSKVSRIQFVFFLAVLAALGWAVSTTVAAQPDLSGTWVLDKEKSDDPIAKIREGGGEPPPNPGFLAPEQLVIHQSGDKIEVEIGERKMSYVTDGQPRDREVGGGFTVQVTAKWEGEQLRVSATSGSMKFETTYQLTGAEQLTVTRRMENPDFLSKPVEVRTVYRKRQ